MQSSIPCILPPTRQSRENPLTGKNSRPAIWKVGGPSAQLSLGGIPVIPSGGLHRGSEIGESVVLWGGRISAVKLSELL
jgi:hypothetical protein